MYQLLENKNGSRGSLAEVWIDGDAGLCKKLYKPNGVTISGKAPLHKDPIKIRQMFENELHWSHLAGDHAVETLDHGELEDGGLYLVQRYHGPDLLQLSNQGVHISLLVPDILGQMQEMFSRFQEVKMYKWNNAMSNLTLCGNRIKAFDFKYAVDRVPENRDYELYTINTWLSKLDPRLPAVLEKYV